MKKLRRFKRSKSDEADQSHRITNETVAEHREKILAGGRRFKYPVQYAKHRLVINTIVISVVALLLVVLVVWWQLYLTQNTSSFFYRITRVIPLPVASIDGQFVPYKDYLQNYRSQEHYLEAKQGVNLRSKENKGQLDWLKRRALDGAIAHSYAEKLAKEKNLRVSAKEVNDAILHQRQSSNGTISEEAYFAIALDHYDWSPEEVRDATAHELLRQKIAYSVDTAATKLRGELEVKLGAESDFDKIAGSISPIDGVKVQASITPLVPSNNQDGGLAEQASKLSPGKTSPIFKSSTGDGYYAVKLLRRENNKISYAVLRVPLTMFQKQLDHIKSEHKIKEYIEIPEVKTSLDA